MKDKKREKVQVEDATEALAFTILPGNIMKIGGTELPLSSVVRWKTGKKKGQVRFLRFTSATELARQGGEARGKKLSKEQLSKIGKQGAAARWKKGGK